MTTKTDHSKRIPIATAKAIADKHGMDQVILVCWDAENGTEHVVTYGKTLADCEMAATGGNKVKAALGWPEEPATMPARTKARAAELALLRELRSAVLAWFDGDEMAAPENGALPSGAAATPRLIAAIESVR